MKKIMLVGRTGSGKTTLAEVLQCGTATSRKTQAIEVLGNIYDTPGEFMENRRLYRALLVTSYDVDVVALVQDVEDPDSLFPPGFGTAFNRDVVGIITKADKAMPLEKAQADLRKAGARRIFVTSAKDQWGLEEIQAFITCKEDKS